MRKKGRYFFFLLFILMLSACSVNQDAANLYKQENPLELEIIIPDSISPYDEVEIKVLLSQGGKKVVNADFVHIEIWKQDGTVNYPLEQAEVNENGEYFLRKSFNEEGLYYIRLHASKNNSVVMPQRQFIVGELADDELNFLKKDSLQKEKNDHSHH